jgi:hypothetical protein
MDFANRGNRPAGTPQQPVGQQQEQPTQSFQPVNNDKKKSGKGLNVGKLATVVLLVFTVAIVVASILMIATADNDNESVSEAAIIQTDKYQALFLDSQDGQVYFGKLAIYNDDLYELTDIYYVRVETPVQPEGEEAAAAQQNISLAKLGNELHGPQDVMYVSRDKVLYWENLKDDGQVVKAISDYKANGEQTPAAEDNSGADETEETQNP